MIADSPIQRVFGSTRTQAHIRRQSQDRGARSDYRRMEENKENVKPYPAQENGANPWIHADPWGKYQRPGQQDGDTPMQVMPKLESIEEKLRGEIFTVVAEATEGRFAKMEVDLAEMRNQQYKFESWCHEAGQAQQHEKGDQVGLSEH